ncbi:hypothetical protein F4779DRAFT_595076 [Xylariaceae sp. FL0662B]|nr:hypothetical protein F4779DRAFT_595076 [Xylariaceae sp. FL0662B]
MAAQRKEEIRVSRIKDRVVNYFTNELNLKYHRAIGDGSHGGTGIYSESDPQTGAELRKFIIKYSLGVLPEKREENSDRHMWNEIKWLDYFNGSQHFIKRIKLAGDNVSGNNNNNNNNNAKPISLIPELVDRATQFLANITLGDLNDRSEEDEPDFPEDRMDVDDDRKIANPYQGSLPPFVILEYLELGDLEHARERMAAYGRPVPIRLLWRLLLCMIRMCIGLAYYENSMPGRRERIPADDRKPSTLSHNSWKPPNILLSFPIPGDTAHNNSPLLKLIDFGRTAFDDGKSEHCDGYGVEKNLWGAGLVIQTLACIGTELDKGRTFIPLRSRIFEPPDEEPFETQSHPDLDMDMNIPFDFTEFVSKLMAVEAWTSPSLQEALNTCLIKTRLAADEEFWYGAPAHETEAGIDQYLREVFLNAPVSSG